MRTGTGDASVAIGFGDRVLMIGKVGAVPRSKGNGADFSVWSEVCPELWTITSPSATPAGMVTLIVVPPFVEPRFVTFTGVIGGPWVAPPVFLVNQTSLLVRLKFNPVIVITPPMKMLPESPVILGLVPDFT